MVGKGPGSACRESMPAPAVTRDSLPEFVRSLERTRERLELVLEEVRRSNQASSPPYSGQRALHRRGSQRSPRALVLSEDSRARRVRVSELLAVGVDVDWARDVDEAVVRASCSPPDVIILDGVRDPRLLLRLLDQLASFDATRHVPVILRSDFSLDAPVVARCAAVVRSPEAGLRIVGAVHALARG
jgi:PleD family two-component response regulator